MIFRYELPIITKPVDIDRLPVAEKNFLFEHAEKGQILFQVPEDFGPVKAKHHKNVYRLGFLYDTLSLLYPQLGIKEKQEIISDKYFFSVTYRRFRELMNEYEQNREKYLKNRKMLGK